MESDEQKERGRETDTRKYKGELGQQTRQGEREKASREKCGKTVETDRRKTNGKRTLSQRKKHRESRRKRGREKYRKKHDKGKREKVSIEENNKKIQTKLRENRALVEKDRRRK